MKLVILLAVVLLVFRCSHDYTTKEIIKKEIGEKIYYKGTDKVFYDKSEKVYFDMEGVPVPDGVHAGFGGYDIGC